MFYQIVSNQLKVQTRLSLKCSAWKGFINNASKKISKKIMGLKQNLKKILSEKNFGQKKNCPKKILVQKNFFKKKFV